MNALPTENPVRGSILSAKQKFVPEIIILKMEDRSWTGGLVQGEGCIFSDYRKGGHSTCLDISVGMTDPAPVFRFSDLVGLTRPSRPKKHANIRMKPYWRKDVIGLRALRVLSEIQPFLTGERLKEAQKALTFFSPRGHHRGCFRPVDIWPSDEFPLRRRPRYLTSTETVTRK